MLTTLIIILDIIGLIMLCFSGKDNKSTLKWCLVILLIPIMGFIIFLLTGYQRHFLKSKHLSYRKVNNGEYARRLLEQHNRLGNENISYKDLVLYNIKCGDALYQKADSVQSFIFGEQKYPALIEDIKSAEHHIHLLYYIFEDDEIGSKIIDALCKKAKQGIEVKLLYDPWGNRTNIEALFNKLRMSGGEVIAYAPVKSKHFLRFNYRNHRKIAVIDGKIGYTGGMNVSKNYANLGKITPWRDTHIRITGEAVYSLQLRFFMDWAYASEQDYVFNAAYYPAFAQTGNIAMQIIAAGPDKTEEPIKNGFLKIINSSRDTLYIATGYFVPGKEILNALKRAAARGVDVRLLVGAVSDHYVMYAVAATYFAELIKAGVKIYYYDGYIHTKLIMADKIIVNIGTANIDIRSFYANFELTAIIYNREIAEEHYEYYMQDLAAAKQKSLHDINTRPLKDKVIGKVMWLIAPLL